tara:strand:- start:1583 stop:2164 length:582 start_codon:yes stop_codon:yes gene_type:complete
MSGKVQGLNREFSKKDVERMRNLIQGKYGDKTQTSVGFTKSQKDYEEGDVWEADGRTWTIKDGIKQNITKLDKAKKAHIKPLFCPNCKKIMKSRHDDKFYKLHKKCFQCVIDMEVKLKEEGKFKEYRKNIINNELDNKIKDFKAWVEDKMNESNNQYVSEAGDVENWKGKINKDKVDEHLENVIEYLEGLKEK